MSRRAWLAIVNTKSTQPVTTRGGANLQLGHCAMQRPTDPTGSDAPRGRVPDVRVREWSMPWTARDGVSRLGPGIPKSDFFASANEGIDQVGCVYTAQGFEFDYVGVIVGPDLVSRLMDGGWVGQRYQSHDRVRRLTARGPKFVGSTRPGIPRLRP